MITFKQFLKDYGKKYVALEYDDASQKKLRQWCQAQGFDITRNFKGNVIPPDEFEFHITVFFSDNEVYLKQGIFEIEPVKITFSKLELLGMEKNIPVALVHKDEALLNIRKIYESTGLTDSWPEWKPHTSFSYNWQGEPDIGKVKLPNHLELFVTRLKVKNQE